MKSFLTVLLFILPCFSLAQPDFTILQQQWLDAVKAGENTSDMYWENQNLTYTKITTKDVESLAQLIRSEKISGFDDYEHFKTFRHDNYRYITVGILSTSSEEMLILTGWRLVEEKWKKEIDVLLTRLTSDFELDEVLSIALNERRSTWIDLANQHEPSKHIEALYANEATYFSNGQKSEGRTQIAERYVYMENPNYQVHLNKEQLWKISNERVLEIGRYFTGPEQVGNGGIYVILWEKIDGEWMIVLDFNF